ncbi:GYD domain-containing protein [Micromonospora sp. GCM10011542]|uniref:GYD domain-containing protein n=1 Tax=Micromonospora sp. GCM10011542 TaxID=3317337 RepID=UPI0036226FB1
MAKFLLRSTYTIDGVRGLVNDGGTKRADVVRKTIEAAGGQMESLYFGFGDHDTYVLCDLPDNSAAAGLAISIRAAGGVDTKITPLLTAQEVDGATHQRAEYAPPGR